MSAVSWSGWFGLSILPPGADGKLRLPAYCERSAAGLAGRGAAPARRPATVPTPASTEALANPDPGARPAPLRFRSSDGKRLRGILTPAGGKGRTPAVVLVHQLNGSPAQSTR